MGIERTTPRPIARAPKTVAMVRIALKHSAEDRTHVVVIEHDELCAWIDHARKHGFSFEAESLGWSQVEPARRVA